MFVIKVLSLKLDCKKNLKHIIMFRKLVLITCLSINYVYAQCVDTDASTGIKKLVINP